jgi:hypothetical protein
MWHSEYFETVPKSSYIASSLFSIGGQLHSHDHVLITNPMKRNETTDTRNKRTNKQWHPQASTMAGAVIPSQKMQQD